MNILQSKILKELNKNKGKSITSTKLAELLKEKDSDVSKELENLFYNKQIEKGYNNRTRVPNNNFHEIEYYISNE